MRIRRDVTDVDASEAVVVIEGLKNAVALDVHLKYELLFWSDVSLNTISVAHLNGSNRQVLVSTDISSPGISHSSPGPGPGVLHSTL